MKHKIRKQKAQQQRRPTVKDNVVYINQLTPQEAVGSLLQNTQQLHMYLTEISVLINDKQNRTDFSTMEWDKLVDCLQQVLYIDHAVKRLLHSMK